MGLRDKASKIDFGNLPASAGIAAGDKVPKTAPGALMAQVHDQRSELMRENESLRVQASQAQRLEQDVSRLTHELSAWDGVRATKLLDPNYIEFSRWANRHEDSFVDPSFLQLRQEIEAAGGNVQPIKVRPLPSSSEERYELVYGHRRLRACAELGLKVLALVDSISDADLFVDMERENRHRKDLSAWEQGMMYRRALDEGLFPSQRKLAERIGADLTNVGKALRLARLPAEVVSAFQTPLDLQFRFAQPLDEALQRDEIGVKRRAAALAARQPRLPAKQVLAELLSPPNKSVPTKQPPIDVDGTGRAVINCSPSGRVDVTFSGPMDPSELLSLQGALAAFLRR